MLRTLPLTRIKITIAKVLYRAVRLFFRKANYLVTRQGIRYEVDLSEGIDLSLFLFGGFQSHVTNNPLIVIPPDATVLDIGANVGAMALQYAQAAPEGRVYAFEPTSYAYTKLQRNLALNPDLGQRITILQALLGSATSNRDSMVAYSSWSLDGSNSSASHQIHGGSAQPTTDASSMTLDEACESLGIQRVDLIKIDTDGYEYEILQGAEKTIARFRPTIVFEIGLYLLKEHDIDIAKIFDFFASRGYVIRDHKKGRYVSVQNHRQIIPEQSTTDLIATSVNGNTPGSPETPPADNSSPQ